MNLLINKIGIIWLILIIFGIQQNEANEFLSITNKSKSPGYMIANENNNNNNNNNGKILKNPTIASGNYRNNYRYKITPNSEHLLNKKARNNNYNDYRSPSEAISTLYYNYYVNDKSYKTHKDWRNKEKHAPQLHDFRELDDLKVKSRKTVNNSLSMNRNSSSEYGSLNVDKISSGNNSQEEIRRVARQTRKQRPGILWTLFRVAFESVNETRSAIGQISDILSNAVQPDPTTKRPGSGMIVLTTTEKSLTNDTNVTTTEAPFVLTQSLLQGIIRRNVKGLVRLFNIEWKDALNQSKVTINEFRHDLGNQIGMNLKDNPDAF
ncbi:putative uncharacterized protein DDB_G0287457 isoform X2 [Leptopilina boulardi]|nr:putative uncharacterized protein DDB_G0287457 isoform X2 [Leptopilina boulardi]XP_051165820.1 putative uncharacterized protein DDB_G0287457 isoform X2 [Leptopilina boulardi]XP_051165821.1 putative uncharacterized protein DDB_G0287457 isoform X2 [Leptopilina boulardi]